MNGLTFKSLALGVLLRLGTGKRGFSRGRDDPLVAYSDIE